MGILFAGRITLSVSLVTATLWGGLVRGESAVSNPQVLSGIESSLSVEWKNSGSTPVLLRSAAKAPENSECRIQWEKVPPVAPGETVGLPVVCRFAEFGASTPQPRSKRFELVALDPKTGKTAFTTAEMMATVYPSGNYTAEPDTCGDRSKSCEKDAFRPRVKLCFYDFRDFRGLSTRMMINAECRGMRQIPVHESAKMGRTLEQIRTRECGIVEEIRIFGHGNSFGMKAGDFVGSPRDFSAAFLGGKDRCVNSENLRVVYKGCNTGHGCTGQMMMYAAAETLGKKKTTVLSPTTYAINSKITLFRSGSVNFKERKLTVDRSAPKPMQEKWEVVGKLSFAGSDTLPNRCHDLCSELKQEANNHRIYWGHQPACVREVADQQVQIMDRILAALDSCSKAARTHTDEWTEWSKPRRSPSPLREPRTSIDKLHHASTSLVYAIHELERSEELRNELFGSCEGSAKVSENQVKPPNVQSNPGGGVGAAAFKTQTNKAVREKTVEAR